MTPQRLPNNNPSTAQQLALRLLEHGVISDEEYFVFRYNNRAEIADLERQLDAIAEALHPGKPKLNDWSCATDGWTYQPDQLAGMVQELQAELASEKRALAIAYRERDASMKAVQEQLAAARADGERLPSQVLAVIEAARCIRHWHNTGRNDEGTIVSSAKVFELWEALGNYDKWLIDQARANADREGK